MHFNGSGLSILHSGFGCPGIVAKVLVCKRWIQLGWRGKKKKEKKQTRRDNLQYSAYLSKTLGWTNFIEIKDIPSVKKYFRS